MPLQKVEVNLWKKMKVSYLLTDSNSTSTLPLHSVDFTPKSPTNMVLDSVAFTRYF